MNILTLFWNYRRNGLNDWRAQRYSVIFIVLYALPLLLFPYFTSHLSAWRELLFHPLMKILGSIAAFSILWHSKIGLWVVVSDYVPRGVLRHLATLMIYIYVWLVFIVALFLFWGEM